MKLDLGIGDGIRVSRLFLAQSWLLYFTQLFSLARSLFARAGEGCEVRPS
jgi:hypothetical protein